MVQYLASGASFFLQFELLDHRLAPQAEEEVVCCQSRHGITGSIGGASNMWENHCGKRKQMTGSENWAQ